MRSLKRKAVNRKRSIDRIVEERSEVWNETEAAVKHKEASSALGHLVEEIDEWFEFFNDKELY